MAEDIKGLIEKIQEEGIRAAEEKAAAIEKEARQKAQTIIEKANSEAAKAMQEAAEKIARMEASSKASLQQAGRDLLLSLKKEIIAMLDKVISGSVREALGPEEMAKIISSLVKECSAKDKAEVVISFNKSDLDKIEKGFLGGLREEIKKGITLKSQEEISAGFIISFDAGRSHFDFTDKALTEYIATHLNPKLAEIIKNVSS